MRCDRRLSLGMALKTPSPRFLMVRPYAPAEGGALVFDPTNNRFGSVRERCGRPPVCSPTVGELTPNLETRFSKRRIQGAGLPRAQLWAHHPPTNSTTHHGAAFCWNRLPLLTGRRSLGGGIFPSRAYTGTPVQKPTSIAEDEVDIDRLPHTSIH